MIFLIQNKLKLKFMNFQKVTKFILVPIITIVVFPLLVSHVVSIVKLDTEYNKKNQNLADEILTKIIAKTEGHTIPNLTLRNTEEITNLSNLMSENKYLIIIYQNGVVCNPCLKLVSNFYQTYLKQSDSVSSNKLIIIGNKNTRATFLELRKYNLERFLYTDVLEDIRQSVIQNSLPVNFVLLIDNKRQIVNMDYFTNETSERLSSFDEMVKKKTML